MTARKKVGAERTILCATRFWSGGHRTRSRTPTLLSGVKHVVRKQGYTTAQINAALRRLEKGGFVAVDGGMHKSVVLTAKGDRVKCSTVSLAPWTDKGYPGAALSGVKKRRKKKSRGLRGCGCR